MQKLHPRLGAHGRRSAHPAKDGDLAEVFARPQRGQQLRRLVLHDLQHFDLSAPNNEQALPDIAFPHDVLARLVHHPADTDRLMDVHVDHVAPEERQNRPIDQHP
jgi:hypothetical protein